MDKTTEPEQQMHSCWWVDEVERLREALEEAEGQFKAIRANLKYGSKDRVEASIGLAEYAAEELHKALGTEETSK